MCGARWEAAKVPRSLLREAGTARDVQGRPVTRQMGVLVLCDV